MKTSSTSLNLAYRKPTKMSSTHYPYVSSRGVDGNKHTAVGQGGCSHTLTEDAAWWQVDLLAIYLIKDVVVTNRAEGSGELELNQSVC